MSEKRTYVILCVLALCSVGHAARVDWTGAGGDNRWDNPANWTGNQVPTGVDEVYVDVPAAAVPNGPVIREGVEAKVFGLACEVPGEPNMAMTGGTLEVAEWIWWGDGRDSHGTFHMSGGTVTTGEEFELGWDGGEGTWIMTGGTVNVLELIIPTGSGRAGQLYLHGGTFNVGSDGLEMNTNGLIDVTEGTLILEGDLQEQIEGLITDGQITAYDGAGYFELDFDERNPGMTTLTANPITGKAYQPDPADGAVDVTFPLLQWGPGLRALLHDVYFGTSPDALESMGRQPMPMYYHPAGVVPGTTYYWRVDEVEADGVTVHTGDVWTFLAQPLVAYLPQPADGANNASPDPNATLTWLAGQNAVEHHVYFGSSFDDVNDGTPDTDKGTTTENTLVLPEALQPLTTYYWRVDETIPGGIVRGGDVWSFTTFRMVEDFESYTDETMAGEAIYDIWIDGWENGTGSRVGYLEAVNGTFGETTIVHGGNQSMPLDYNNVDAPHYSETSRTWAAQNWAVSDISAVALYVHGQPSNAVEPLYVALQDTALQTGVAVHPDPTVVATDEWTEWEVPLSAIGDAGVNLTAIKTMMIGLGDRSAPTPGGLGLIYVDDVQVRRPKLNAVEQ